MMTDTSSTKFLRDYSPSAFLISDTDLHFDLDAEVTRVRSLLTIRRNPNAMQEAHLILDGIDLSLSSLSLNGIVLSSADFLRTDNTLTVFNVPDHFLLETVVAIHPSKNTTLEGLFVSRDMLCTQCEPEGFRRITYFIDRPDVLSTFSVTLRGPQTTFPTLLSNGNLIDLQIGSDGISTSRWVDPFPKPSYLFALVAGRLRPITDHYTTASGRSVTLSIYVEERDLDKCDHALASLKRAMKWDEDSYGREYDLDLYNIVAVSHFNMGAMENKGLNIFNSKFVLGRNDTATDEDFLSIERVVAHEYFHNWTGNRITCRDWFQLSLKEGLTVYRDQEFSSDINVRDVERIRQVCKLRERQFPEDEGPLAHSIRPTSYIEINNFYTATIYDKGAEVIRMMATIVGPAAFRAGMDQYFQRYDGNAVTTEDFVCCIEEASGRDLIQFRQWYEQPGTPELTISSEYDSEKRDLAISIRQRNPRFDQGKATPLHIPLAIGLIDSYGAELSPMQIIEVRKQAHVEHFSNVSKRPTISLLRGFSAPVKLLASQDRSDLLALFTHDKDGFARWEAGQELFVQLITPHEGGTDEQFLSAVLSAIPVLFHQEDLHPLLLASLLDLPSEAFVGQQMPIIDIEGIHKGRNELAVRIGQELYDLFKSMYLRLRDADSTSRSSLAMGQRALKNRCLEFLTRSGSSEAVTYAHDQFEYGSNMTDTIAALSALIDLGSDVSSGPIRDFYNRWKEEELVIDKWFSLQSSRASTETLEAVKKLVTHPDFTFSVPNRVRSVVEVFANINPIAFHAPNGQGYRFVREQAQTIDRGNPHLAARLLRPLTRWQRLDHSRRQAMLAELHAVLNADPAPSKNMFEVASKGIENS